MGDGGDWVKSSPNIPCPCQSGTKYKKCCRPYHLGGWAPDAPSLMRSRYSAYALNLPDYIIATTHPNNPDFTTDTARWRAEITAFCTQTEFRGLTILDVEAGNSESYVTFRAKLSTGDMIERSRFVYEEGRWWYVDGEVATA